MSASRTSDASIEGNKISPCNICGGKIYPSRTDREAQNCMGCGSTPRWRAVVHVLSMELFDEDLTIAAFPERRDLKGVGLSDSRRYAERLPEKLDYRNTYYEKEPRLDITDPPAELRGTLDFLISSDVFEHVVPPVERAFQGTFDLLKPGGLFVLTVPHAPTGDTEEFFPNLHDFEILEFKGSKVLLNRTRDGEWEVFDELIWHGGKGFTLAMRRFGEEDLLNLLREMGFVDVKVWPQGWVCGDPITARKP